MLKHKVIIVGAGPAGLTAGIYAGRANLNPLIAEGEVSTSGESFDMPGGQLMITDIVENYPGFPQGIKGEELMDQFKEQAQKFDCTIISNYATEFNLPPGGPFKVKVNDTWYETEAVIFATGASVKWLNLPNEEKFRNKGISACATCDGWFFKNKHIYVVGGGDSAVEEALFLTKFGSQVTIIHRRDKLRASKIMQKRALEHPKIDFRWNTVIEAYKGEGILQQLVLKNVNTQEIFEEDAGGLFIAIGHQPNSKYLVNSGLELENGYIKVHNQILTNIDGVFAAGDIHDTHYRQAITAAGFGAMAAITAERWMEAKNS